MIGQTISHYRILDKLGEGGMGVVWKAEDLHLKRLVALKFLHASNDLPRLLREAQIAASLNHPNICSVYEVDPERGFLAMELVEGDSLAAKIAGRPLPVDQAVGLAIQICQGLKAAHDKSILHRDIKSGNVLVAADGRAKILDFGLARAGGETALTREGVAAGTPGYMAPEQMRGESADRRTDIWAAGAVLHEMLTGRLPMRQPETLPEGLGRVVRKALAIQPGERYQHVDDLLVDLWAMASSQASSARRGARRLWSLAVAASCAAVAIAALVFVLSSEKPARSDPSRWVQVTNFTDSATSPALSPDGRMLAFLRGPSTFFGPSEVFVKLLPNGDPVQLTRDGLPKMSPVFSPDASRVAFTVVTNHASVWDTWDAPVLGGQPRPWLPNASGLTWTGPDRLLFSEIITGFQMALVASLPNRAESRFLYTPAVTGMAHRSSLSPDGHWVLLAEMDRGIWLRCRLVPFDGSSAGNSVGPEGPCTYTAWSPEGKWMYFSSRAGGSFHLWRQRFPDGAPEQITSGPNEEEGIAVAPDSRSLFTSLGVQHSGVRVRDSRGERELLVEGYAYVPHSMEVYRSPFSADGKRFFFLVNRGLKGTLNWAARPQGELWAADLESGRTEPVLTGFDISSYSLAADGDAILFTAWDLDGTSGAWLGSLSRRHPPKRLAIPEAEFSRISRDGQIYFRASEGNLGYLARFSSPDLQWTKIWPNPIIEFKDLSSDGTWAMVSLSESLPRSGHYTAAVPLQGGPPRRICDNCLAAWSHGGKFLYLWLGEQSGHPGSGFGSKSFLIPLPPGQMLPQLPPAGIRSEEDLARLRVARSVPGAVYFGPDPSVQVWTQSTTQRNIYRIPLP